MRGIATAAFLVLVTAGMSTAQAAPGTAVVGGRITFRDGQRKATASEVERMRWGHITLELRRGWEVFPARLDDNGVFTVTGPPGTYRVEYIRLGELAEFFVPHDVEAKADRVTCLGTLEVSVGDLKQDLGSNVASELHVVDDCATLGPELGRASGGAEGQVQTSLAHPAPTPGKSLTAMDVLVAFRFEGDVAGGDLASARLAFVLPFGHDSNVLFSTSLMSLTKEYIDQRWLMPVGGAPIQDALGGTLGIGYRLWILEAHAYGGFLENVGRGPHGPLGGGQLRLGNFLFGIGGRLEWYGSGDRVGALTIDFSPVGLLGSLL